MISYDRLWETLKQKKISQYRLIKYYGFSAGQIGRLKKNMYVSTHTIDVLCRILDCGVDDIMEYRLDLCECGADSKTDEAQLRQESSKSEQHSEEEPSGPPPNPR